MKNVSMCLLLRTYTSSKNKFLGNTVRRKHFMTLTLKQLLHYIKIPEYMFLK